MKLFYSGASPYVRKVMVTAHIGGLTDRITLVPGSGSPLAPNVDTCAVNPLGKIPCLVTDDGLALFDSRVITRYLDALAGTGLYPEGDALWAVLARESLAEGIIDAALLVIYEGRLRPEELRFAPFVQAQMSKIQRGMGALEGEARRFSPTVDAAQITIGSALGYLDFRFPDLNWREGRPALAEWFEALSAHPAMQATVPQG
jgi:glutathione S-transferase